MGPGIVIIFWLFIAGVYGFIFLVLAGLCILGWKKHWKWLKWITGIPATVMAILAVFLPVLFIFGAISSTNPRNVFKNTFDAPPSSEVNDIHSSLWWFADTGSVYLTFKTSKSEFLRLVPAGLTERTMENMRKDMPHESGSEPSWWTFRYDQNWIYFLRDDQMRKSPGKKGFYSETEYFAYDPNTRIAYYRFLGID